MWIFSIDNFAEYSFNIKINIFSLTHNKAFKIFFGLWLSKAFEGIFTMVATDFVDFLKLHLEVYPNSGEA